MSDPVNKPAHYCKGKVECIDAIESATQGIPGPVSWYVGQVMKYVWRFHWKGRPKEDLEKAKFYLERLINLVK